ncbi:hypothetical protein Tco_0372380, partial [Tanacetum coccineum]
MSLVSFSIFGAVGNLCIANRNVYYSKNSCDFTTITIIGDPAGGHPAGPFQPAGSYDPAAMGDPAAQGDPAASTSVSADFIPV